MGRDVALVVLAEGEAASEQDLIDYCENGYKCRFG